MPTAPCPAPATAQQRKRAKSKTHKAKKKDTLSGVRKTKPTRSQVGFCYCKAYKSAPFIVSAKMSLRGYCTDSPALSRLFCFSMSLQSAATRHTLQSKAFRNSPAEAGSTRLLQPLHELREDDVRSYTAAIYVSRCFLRANEVCPYGVPLATALHPFIKLGTAQEVVLSKRKGSRNRLP